MKETFVTQNLVSTSHVLSESMIVPVAPGPVRGYRATRQQMFLQLHIVSLVRNQEIDGPHVSNQGLQM